MKLKVLIFCILFVQTSASFFDEFRGAMSSVENSFGRLLSDVVTDVRETIGCTILAVKQVLALGGVYHESSDYNTICRGRDGNGNDASTYVQENSEASIVPPLLSEHERKNDIPFKEQISEEIHQSVSNAHNSVFNLIEKSYAHERAKVNIAHERRRLAEISALLHRELGSISDEVKKELRQVESNSHDPSVDAIWTDIKALHAIEISHRNTPQATEIRHILNEIASILHEDDKKTGAPLQYSTESAIENESNDAFSEIQSQFEKIEQEHKETNGFNNVYPEDNAVNKNAESDLLPKSEGFPLTFKGVAKKIMDETSRTFRFADGSSQEYEHVATTTTEAVTTEKYIDYNGGLPDYSAFFQSAPKGSPAHKEAVQGAKTLIEKSKQTESIMNDYFKNTERVGTSVFDDPSLLGFA